MNLLRYTTPLLAVSAIVFFAAGPSTSARACAACRPPEGFEATHLAVAQVTGTSTDVWQACLRGEWREVARVAL